MTHFLHDLAFIARQYNALLASGLTSQQALTSLEIALADTRAHAWQVWLHLLDSDSGAHVLAVDKRDSFTQLLCRLKENQGDPTRLPQAIERGVGALVISTQRFWLGLSSSLFYFFVVMLVAVVCWGVYLLHVLPSFQNFFGMVGAELPTFTQRFLLMGGQTGQWLMAGALILLLLVLLAVVHAYDVIQRMQPLTGLVMRLPGLKRLAGFHNQQLLVAAAALVAETVSQEHPVPLAAEWMGIDLQRDIWHDMNPAWQELLLADQLGTAASELNYWLATYPDIVQQQMGQLSRTLFASMQVFALVTVGALLLAVYLPLFAMGDALF